LSFLSRLHGRLFYARRAGEQGTGFALQNAALEIREVNVEGGIKAVWLWEALTGLVPKKTK